MESRETIAAIATGMGNAGIGIVRISGDAAITVADRVFKGKSNKKLSESRSHMLIMDIYMTVRSLLMRFLCWL